MTIAGIGLPELTLWAAAVTALALGLLAITCGLWYRLNRLQDWADDVNDFNTAVKERFDGPLHPEPDQDAPETRELGHVLEQDVRRVDRKPAVPAKRGAHRL